MNVLERCWIATHLLTERVEVFTGESSELQKFRDMESWTVTEYVPATTTQGAVKTLREIEAIAVKPITTSEAIEVRMSAIRAKVAIFLRDMGGQ